MSEKKYNEYFTIDKNFKPCMSKDGINETPDYWMNFYANAYGMHDATWRGSFGGKIYKYNGSHGCVNIPLEAAMQLYPILNVGTPVIIFY